MNKNKFQKGFTLIELLVVIAIIGILASFLLVNLANTRNRAKDAAIKLEMSQIRAAVEDFRFDQNPNTYVGACGAGTECATLETDIVAKGAGTVVQNFSVDKYCVQYPMNTGTWCVDSTGYAGGTNIFCDITNLDCVTP